MNKETIVIDGVRYYADRPQSCRGCYFWKNRKVGCILFKIFWNCYGFRDVIGIINTPVSGSLMTVSRWPTITHINAGFFWALF